MDNSISCTFNSLIRDIHPLDLHPTDLPFVKYKKKKKNKGEMSYWNVKPTGNYEFDRAIGTICAVELASYLMMQPKSKDLHSKDFFSLVMAEMYRKEKNPTVLRAFTGSICEILTNGAHSIFQKANLDTYESYKKKQEAMSK